MLEYDTGVVYFEDIPQFILQLYILWKTPLQCLTFDWSYLTWDNLTYENWSAGEFDILKSHMPNLIIDQSDCLKIAMPNKIFLYPSEGFWEIQSKGVQVKSTLKHSVGN